MADTPKKTQVINSPEKDEIPPDTDIKNQYKNAAENNAVSQQANQEGQEYEVAQEEHEQEQEQEMEQEQEQEQEQEEVEEEQVEEEEEVVEEEEQVQEEEQVPEEQGQEYVVNQNVQGQVINQEGQNYQNVQTVQTAQNDENLEPLESYEIIHGNQLYQISQPTQNYQMIGRSQEYETYKLGEPFEVTEDQQTYNAIPSAQEQQVYNALPTNQGQQVHNIIPSTQNYQYVQSQQTYTVTQPQIIHSGQNQQFVQLNQNKQMMQGTRQIQQLQPQEYQMGLRAKFRRGKPEINQNLINKNLTRNINLGRNEGPSDSSSKGNIGTRRFFNAKKTVVSERYKAPSLYSRIPPPLISFEDIYTKQVNLKSNLDIETKNLEDYVEIPKEEYQLHANKDTLFLEGGMNTGRYKFRGESTIIEEVELPRRVQVSEEEILQEISRRAKKKQEKKVKYEVVDKFYAITEYESKIVRDIRDYQKENDKEVVNKKITSQVQVGGGKDLQSKVITQSQTQFGTQAQVGNIKVQLKSQAGSIQLQSQSQVGNLDMQSKSKAGNIQSQSQSQSQIGNLDLKSKSQVGNIQIQSQSQSQAGNLQLKSQSQSQSQGQGQGQAQATMGMQMQMNMKNAGGANYSSSSSYQNANNNYGNNIDLKTGKLIAPLDNYSRYLLEQINKIRIDPQSFIGMIEDSKANIMKYKNGSYVYNGKIKIALSDGYPAFDEAIEFLQNTEAMEILEFSPEITVDLPQNIEELKNTNDLKIKVESMVSQGINIKSYWKDIVRDPEISFLLMIVDDHGSRRGRKGKDILNPKMKYIGISSTEINGNFVCYLTLSPSKYIV